LVSTNPTVQVTVFEGSDRVGGIVQTVRRDGFVIELGPDNFITNKPGAIRLADEIGFRDQLIPTEAAWRRSLVLRNGQPMQVPEGFMLMAPSKPMAILTTPILSLRGKLRLLAEALIPRRRSEDDESLADFVRRRFGRETLDRLVQPLVGGIYTSDPEKLSIQATLPRFPEMERRYGSVIRATLYEKRTGTPDDHDESSKTRAVSGSGARYGLFLSAKDGLGTMMTAIADVCRNSGRVEFRMKTPVTSIRHTLTSDGTLQWTVESTAGSGDGQTGSDRSEVFDAVIITLPAWAAAGLLKADAFAALRKALLSIEYAGSAIVVSAHDLADFTHPMDAFGLVIPHQEKRRILAISFSSRKFPGRAPAGQILLRTFVGGAMQPELLGKSDEEILQLVDEELRSILGLRRPAKFAELVRYNRAMPQYHVGHLLRIQEIEQAAAAFPGLGLAGSTYYGVGIPDSIDSARKVADALL
ncbi:MAG: protoporphyrinogen oxidase, partial [Planctomycetaceae bacterium]|nr:protoporphyrinogen oxidase [Planctomycetaceae bacterium]